MSIFEVMQESTDAIKEHRCQIYSLLTKWEDIEGIIVLFPEDINILLRCVQLVDFYISDYDLRPPRYFTDILAEYPFTNAEIRLFVNVSVLGDDSFQRQIDREQDYHAVLKLIANPKIRHLTMKGLPLNRLLADSNGILSLIGGLRSRVSKYGSRFSFHLSGNIRYRGLLTIPWYSFIYHDGVLRNQNDCYRLGSCTNNPLKYLDIIKETKLPIYELQLFDYLLVLRDELTEFKTTFESQFPQVTTLTLLYGFGELFNDFLKDRKERFGTTNGIEYIFFKYLPQQITTVKFVSHLNEHPEEESDEDDEMSQDEGTDSDSDEESDADEAGLMQTKNQDQNVQTIKPEDNGFKPLDMSFLKQLNSTDQQYLTRPNVTIFEVPIRAEDEQAWRRLLPNVIAFRYFVAR